MGGTLKWLLFLSGFFLILAIDQATKITTLEYLVLGQTIEVIPQYLNWTYVSNYGAAFGAFASAPEPWRTWFFMAVTVVAILLSVYVNARIPYGKPAVHLALGALLGGAMGNFLDRYRFGYVIDFVDFHWRSQWSLPAFNVADVAIVVCAFWLFWYYQWGDEKTPSG
ncbi:MAG: signal peptidase II [Bdellovibrionaceae bacterium]|jgi:signal peptidase II|nr:signal peptidase II [Pseudobdellovibrionaceae bacterium]